MNRKVALLCIAVGAAGLFLCAPPHTWAQDPPPDAAEEPAAPDAPPDGAPAEEAPDTEADASADTDAADPYADPEPAPEDSGAVDQDSAYQPAATEEAAPEAGVPADAEPDAAEAPPEDEEELVITGTRIKRSVFNSAAPIMTMNRKQIEQTGAHNVEDLLQHLTIAQGNGFLGGAGAASPGTARVNLRGLGTGSTLVLLNGRRLVPGASGITVASADIATIPLAVVERIEVLKAGASAIYGTDAIAGVVNIITRKDWEGMRMQADGRTATRFDHREGTASIAIGASGEKARVVGGVSYLRRTRLKASDRDFTANEGPEGGQAGNISAQGNPGSFLVGTALMPDPDCEMAPPSSMLIERGLCTFSFTDFQYLVGDTERTTVYAHGEYDISDYAKMFAEVNASKTRAETSSSPSFPTSTRAMIPADHPDNPWGADASFIGRPLGAAAGGTLQSTDDDTLRTAFGLTVDFEGVAANTLFEDWTWELVTTFGVSRYHRVLPDTVLPAFQDAINSCSDPGDLTGCFNPFYSSQLGTGTQNTQAVVDSFTGHLISIIDQHLQTYGTGVSGSLAELAGGDLGFAIGGEIRREQRTSQLDHDSNEFDLGFYFGNDDAAADRDIAAAYAELGWPFLEGLEVTTAGRVERYTDVGTTLNATGGLNINAGKLAGSGSRILTGLTLRGIVSESFRAPAVFQTFNGSTTVPASLVDGVGTTPLYRPINRSGNPDLKPEKALTITAGATWQPADEFRLEVDYWNYNVRDFIRAENAQEILFAEIESGMSNPKVLRDATGALIGINTQFINQGTIRTHGIDVLARVRLDTGSPGIFRVGIDGTFVLGFLVPTARVPNVDGAKPEFCDPDDCNVTGKLNSANIASASPALRFNLPVGWSLDDHAATLTLHYMSGIEDWNPSRYNAEMGGHREIDSFTTLDFNYTYTLGNVIGRKTMVRVGLLNLLDQAPPFADITNSYVATLHDPRGRMAYASLTQEF